MAQNFPTPARRNNSSEPLIEEEDYYFEGGLMVFTRAWFLKRGSCCGSGCRHCPYLPRGVFGTTTVAPEPLSAPRARTNGPGGED
ncbi:MAG: DUF5522 domain-containing protein [Blastocatellia bacterium]